jgi:hypothetical protein
MGIVYFENTDRLLYLRIRNNVRLCIKTRGNYKIYVGIFEFIVVKRKKKGKALPATGMKAHRVVRRRGSHVF